MDYLEEIKRRRTFGIVSHPDAGKTTLTEKLLLFGGAIRVAGAVKSNKIKKGATSDFMEIERQRGISVATSVMGFEYRNYKVNILDTPGHQDFQEDTFRTLTAVDSVIIVIDAAKGVEPQTQKLMSVCRMRKTPVIVFINKLDRPARDTFSLLDEIEEQLHVKTRPLSWPINSGADFKGVYNIYKRSLNLFDANVQEIEEGFLFEDINDPELEKYIGTDASSLREDWNWSKGFILNLIMKPTWLATSLLFSSEVPCIISGYRNYWMPLLKLHQARDQVLPKNGKLNPRKKALPGSFLKFTPTSTRTIAAGSLS